MIFQITKQYLWNLQLLGCCSLLAPCLWRHEASLMRWSDNECTKWLLIRTQQTQDKWTQVPSTRSANKQFVKKGGTTHEKGVKKAVNTRMTVLFWLSKAKVPPHQGCTWTSPRLLRQRMLRTGGGASRQGTGKSSNRTFWGGWSWDAISHRRRRPARAPRARRWCCRSSPTTRRWKHGSNCHTLRFKGVSESCVVHTSRPVRQQRARARPRRRRSFRSMDDRRRRWLAAVCCCLAAAFASRWGGSRRRWAAQGRAPSRPRRGTSPQAPMQSPSFVWALKNKKWL